MKPNIGVTFQEKETLSFSSGKVTVSCPVMCSYFIPLLFFLFLKLNTKTKITPLVLLITFYVWLGNVYRKLLKHLREFLFLHSTGCNQIVFASSVSHNMHISFHILWTTFIYFLQKEFVISGDSLTLFWHEMFCYKTNSKMQWW